MNEPTWTVPIITAIFTGLLAVIAAFTTMVVTIKNTSKVAEIHTLVNGSNTALLEKVDRLTTYIAKLTGNPQDIIESDAAKHDVEAKAEITLEAKKL